MNFKYFSLLVFYFVFPLALVFNEVLLHPLTKVLSLWEGDSTRHSFPMEYFETGEILRGRLPLWNPNIYCGAPFFGNFLSAALYPVNWIFLFSPMPLALNLDFLFHEVWPEFSCTCG